ncbi:MAG TPA: DUF3185 family protein [Opitutaceae bacterium]|jgi:hypothetical protein|nr:DUF3185 family protein [Opitutaceae bacterium]
MSKSIALVLIIAGAGVVWHGFQVRDSVKGKAQDVSSDVQKSWNGETKITDATWFMAGGGVLLAAGLVVALKK